ncbi:MAG: cytochrome c [Bacteroidetes bacterium]|nr:cytochrome c [Bacteroidota bacterium]
MKNKMKIATISLTGIAVASFLIFGSNALAGGNQKEKQSSKPWPCPERYVKMVNPIKPDEGILAAGKEVWENNCKSCHGRTGKGDGPKVKNLDFSPIDFSTDEYQSKTDGELFWRATEGRKPMPHNKDKISDIERWSVILYTRTFAKKAGEPEVPNQKEK